MATTHQLLRIAARDTDADATDGTLLRRYATARDEAAFAELVRRNGPVVFRACRHVLGEATAAEDAFQATFLLLAREAERLTRPGSLAGWLHAAAVRVARSARRTDARARRRERAHQLPLSKPDPDDLSWREVRQILDAELAALPEKYRAPLVLCYFQELSYEAAARRIGCPIGTLRGRLERGKEQLRKRLARYRLSLAAPVLVVGCPPPVSAALVEAALGVIRSVKSGTVPPALAALLPPTARLRVALLFAPLLAALVAVGVALATGGSPAADAPKIDPPRPASPVAEAAPQPRLDRLGDPLPAGAVARLGTRRLFGIHGPRWAAYSPDGKKVATMGYAGVTVCDITSGRSLIDRRDYWVENKAIGWRADGAGVAVIRLADRSCFVSAFTDSDEKLPNPPPLPRGPGRGAPNDQQVLALSPDATHLAAARAPDEKQFTIDLLPATVGMRVDGLKPEKTLGPFTGPCQEIRFTPRGILLLTGSWAEGDWTLSVIDPDMNRIVRTITIPPPAYCAYGLMYSLSADGRFAAIPYRPKTMLDAGTFTNEHDGALHVWNLETGKEVRSIPFLKAGYGTGHAFTPDCKALITAGEKPYFLIWDMATGKEVARAPERFGVPKHSEAPSIAVSPDGKRFVTARRDGRIDVWDTATAEPVISLDTHRFEIGSVAVSLDGRLAATIGNDAGVRVWELANGRPVCAVAAPRASSNPYAGPRRRPAFTPDGRGLLFASGKGLVQVDPMTGKALELPGALRGAEGVIGDFSADGGTLVTLVRDTVTLWNWPAGTVRLTVRVPLAPQKPAESREEVVRVDYAARLSPDGRFLFTNSVREPKGKPEAGGVQNANDVWDARTGKHLYRLEKPEPWYPPAQFSPEGRVLYLGGHSLDWPDRSRVRGDALTAWDPATGKLLRRFVEPDRTGQPRQLPDFGRKVQALAVSPDGRLLAASESATSFDGVWVYEAASGRPLKKFVGHVGDATDLAFSSDGRRLVSVSTDQTGLVWDVTLPALVTGRVGKPAAKDLADAWERLGGADPVPGYLGIATLVAAPVDAVALFKAKLQPAPIPTNADLDRVTTQLGADEPADREKASAELERFGPNAIAGAKARLGQTESAEARDRLTRFLTRYNGLTPSPYEIRCIRGAAALEEIGTAEAKELLNQLSRGKADDVLTREAAAAHRRASNR